MAPIPIIIIIIIIIIIYLPENKYRLQYNNVKTRHDNQAGRLRLLLTLAKTYKTRMWANAQRDGRPAEYRWRPLFNAAKFG